MIEKPLSPDAEKLIHDLQRGGLAFRRLEAAEKIAKMAVSHPRLVLALLRAREWDRAEEVRKAADAALGNPAHKEILDADPSLIDQAKVEETEILKPSVLGWISFGLAIVANLIIYLDIFFLGARPDSSAPATIDISPLFCLSFLLSIVGLVLGIVGIRQYGRRKTVVRLGLFCNGLIFIGTLLLTMVVKFKVQ
jgi:hypothetical protein